MKINSGSRRPCCFAPPSHQQPVFPQIPSLYPDRQRLAEGLAPLEEWERAGALHQLEIMDTLYYTARAGVLCARAQEARGTVTRGVSLSLLYHLKPSHPHTHLQIRRTPFIHQPNHTHTHPSISHSPPAPQTPDPSTHPPTHPPSALCALYT